MPTNKLSKESSKALGYYNVYRDLGAKRSITKAVEKLQEMYGKKAPGQSALEKLSQAHDWVQRACAYDMQQDKILLESRENAIKLMGDRQANMALVLQQKALQRINNMKPEDLDIDQALDYLEKGIKLERMARGESKEITAQANSLTWEIVEEILNEVSEEEAKVKNAAPTPKS